MGCPPSHHRSERATATATASTAMITVVPLFLVALYSTTATILPVGAAFAPCPRLLMPTLPQNQHRPTPLSYSYLSSTSLSLSSSSSSSTSESSSSRTALEYIASQPLTSLIPRDDAVAVLNELWNDASLLDDAERVAMQNWDKLERKLREENRSTAEILGKETTEKVLRSVRNVDGGYDPDAVRAFLGSDAANELFAKVLYDGIYQFFQTIDVFGNIISKLPIIGPIRNQIRDETKRQLDRTVGPLIQSFLRTYTKVAVREAVDFVNNPSNRESFGKANVRLVSSVMDRPVRTLVPPSESSSKWRDDAIRLVRDVKVEELEEYVDFAYGLVGDKSLEWAGVDVDRILDASPTLRRTVDDVWEKAVNTNTKVDGEE